MKVEKIFFNPQEVMAIGLGLSRVIDDLNAMKEGKNANLPWTPDARKAQKEMLAACKSAAAKLEKFAGYKCELPPYNEGDENEFFTKQS